jgi:hypothetical protein
MDVAEFIFAAVCILAAFEVFAVRRHNETIKTLNLINDTLNIIQDQTDTHRSEKLQKTKDLLRSEFSEVSEWIDDAFTKRVFIYTRSIVRTQLDFIRDLGGKNEKERKRIVDNRKTLVLNMAKALGFPVEGTPDKVTTYISSLPEDELDNKFQKILREVHADIL